MTSTFGCPHCGKPNPLAVVFCAACGAYLQGLDTAELARNAPPAVPPAEDAPPPQDETRKRPYNPVPSQPWLRPNFDESDPQSAETSPSPVDEQPWLAVDREAQDAARSPRPAPQRLIGGLQGLIEPLEMDQTLFQPESTTPTAPGMADLSYEMRRELRQLFATDLLIQDDPSPNAPDGGLPGGLPGGPAGGQSGTHGRGLWRRNWIYGLLLAAILLALWTSNAAPDSRPHSWPGVTAAYSAIDSLPPNAVVLVNWAYDPAHASEMDLAALPVVEHLLEKGARLLVISQLPGGPASARRLLAVARSGASQAALNRQLGEGLIEGGYLPGGVGSLSLLGQAPAQGLPVDIQGRSVRNRAAITALDNASPALLLVVAARSEEVQRWIEQIQPLNRAPLIAVTSAAVDPAIRPYVDSGQIVGLVSGYAGAIEYRDLLADVLPKAGQEAQRRHITGQNWALAVLLLVIAVGNLAGLAERREP